MPTIFRTEPISEDIKDRIEDMIHNLGQDSFQQAHAPLYEKRKVIRGSHCMRDAQVLQGCQWC